MINTGFILEALRWWGCDLNEQDREELASVYKISTIRHILEYWKDHVKPWEHLRKDL